MNKRSNWAIPYAIFLAFFVVLPLILIFVYAFRNTGGGFTFQNFIKFFKLPVPLGAIEAMFKASFKLIV